MTWTCALAVASLMTAQDSVVWHQYAEQLPKGAVVQVRASGEGRFTAVLGAVDEAGITVLPQGRIRQPPRHIRFDDLVELEPKRGRSLAARVAVGTAAGLGVFYGILGILIATLH